MKNELKVLALMLILFLASQLSSCSNDNKPVPRENGQSIITLRPHHILLSVGIDRGDYLIASKDTTTNICYSNYYFPASSNYRDEVVIKQFKE